MATAEKLNPFIPPAAMAPSIVLANAGSTINSTTAPQSTPSDSSSKRVKLTAVAPTLTPATDDSTDPALALINEILASVGDKDPKAKAAVNALTQLIEELEQTTGTPSADLLDKVKASFSAILQSAIPNDPKFAAVAAALTDSIEKLFAMTPSTAPADVDAQIKSFYTALSQLMAQITPATSGSSSASGTTGTTPVEKPNNLTPDQKGKFEILLAMMALLLKLQVDLAKAYSEQLADSNKFTTATTTAAKIAGDKAVAEMSKQEDEIEAAKHQSFWQKLGSALLGGLAIVVTFIFLGPVAAVFVAALFVMQQTGGMDAMLSGLGTGARIGVEIGFAVGVALAGGGISGVIDGATAVAADAAGTAAEVTAAAARTAAADAASSAAGSAAGDASAVVETEVSDIASIELENLGASVEKNAAEEAAAAAKADPAKEPLTFKQAFGDYFASTGKAIFMQSFFSTSTVSDVLGTMTKDKKLLEALTITISVLAMLLAAYTGSQAGGNISASKMAEGVGKAAETSKAWSALNTAMKALRSPGFTALMGGVTLGLTAFTSYWGVQLAKNQKEQADTTLEQTTAQALFMAMSQLTYMMQSDSDRVSKNLDSTMKALSASNQSAFQALSLPMQYAAQLLA